MFMPVKKEGSDNIANGTAGRKVHLEEKLIENLVELQKVHANLAEKFDSLSTQISSLLTLFEGAAQNFAKNPVNQFSEKDQEFLEKIDRLLDQNKTIAKGLTMMEERIREKIHVPGSPISTPNPSMNIIDEKNEIKTEQNSSVNNRPLPKF